MHEKLPCEQWPKMSYIAAQSSPKKGEDVMDPSYKLDRPITQIDDWLIAVDEREEKQYSVPQVQEEIIWEAEVDADSITWYDVAEASREIQAHLHEKSEVAITL